MIQPSHAHTIHNLPSRWASARLPLPWSIKKVQSGECRPTPQIKPEPHNNDSPVVNQDSFSRTDNAKSSDYKCQDPRKSVGGIRSMSFTRRKAKNAGVIKRTLSERIHRALNHGHEGTETLMAPLEIGLGLTGSGVGYLSMGILSMGVGLKILTRNATGKHAGEYNKGHRNYHLKQAITKLLCGSLCLSGGALLLLTTNMTPTGNICAALGLFAQALNAWQQSRQASHSIKVIKSLVVLGRNDETVSASSLESLEHRAKQLKRSCRNARLLALGAALTALGITALAAAQIVIGPTTAVLTVVSYLAYVGYSVTAGSIVSIWLSKSPRKKQEQPIGLQPASMPSPQSNTREAAIPTRI